MDEWINGLVQWSWDRWWNGLVLSMCGNEGKNPLQCIVSVWVFQGLVIGVLVYDNEAELGWISACGIDCICWSDGLQDTYSVYTEGRIKILPWYAQIYGYKVNWVKVNIRNILNCSYRTFPFLGFCIADHKVTWIYGAMHKKKLSHDFVTTHERAKPPN